MWLFHWLNDDGSDNHDHFDSERLTTDVAKGFRKIGLKFKCYKIEYTFYDELSIETMLDVTDKI